MRSPRRWAAAVELDFWVSTSWIHMKPIRGRWFEKCFQMTIQKRLEKKRSIFEEFLHEIEPIQRMKRETVGGKKFMKVFSSCYVKPYGDATFWKKLSTWKIHSRIWIGRNWWIRFCTFLSVTTFVFEYTQKKSLSVKAQWKK